jgi:hypothetical protein
MAGLALVSPEKVGRGAGQAYFPLAEDRQASVMTVEMFGGFRANRAGPANLGSADEASRRDVTNPQGSLARRGDARPKDPPAAELAVARQ